ncbi:MAG: acetate uptake transporter [Thermoproteota archaeon]
MTEKLANPAPLGLLGFGVTTVLLNLHNAGFYPFNSMIVAMGLAYGGLAQVIAGIMEFKRGNAFGTVAFSSYGLFWWSLILLLVFPQVKIWMVEGTPLQPADSNALAAYFFMWGLFTLMMFFGTLNTNRSLQFVFMSLAVLFFLLTAHEITGYKELGLIAGYEGIICGLSAVYTALAEVLNGVHGKTILPL